MIAVWPVYLIGVGFFLSQIQQAKPKDVEWDLVTSALVAFLALTWPVVLIVILAATHLQEHHR